MMHPSYSEMIATANREVEPDQAPVVQSRYSIVLAAAKRARQLVSGDEALVDDAAGKKPLSVAVEELSKAAVKIVRDDEAELDEEFIEPEREVAKE